jgi:subtilisin family serine protease
VNTPNLPQFDDPLDRTAEALRSARSSFNSSPDELTRARQIKGSAETARNLSLPQGRGQRSMRVRSLLAAAAAVALIATTAFITTTSDSPEVAIGNSASPAGASTPGETSTSATNPTTTLPSLSAAERAARTPSPVPFERTEDYVILTVEADKVAEVQRELTNSSGAEPTKVAIGDRSTTFVVPASVAATLSTSDGVTSVADTPIRSFNDPIEQSPVPSWGLDRIDAVDVPLDNRYSYRSSGSGVRVYVIDTGIRADHVDLAGRVGSGWNAIADDQGTNDCNGHGTHVAGTVAGSSYGVAKSAMVIPVRVLDCTGSGFTSSVIAGVNWVITNHPGGPAVINMSLGGPANSTLDRAVADAAAAGITVVAAAGNSNTDACSTSPARAPQALTIGATTSTDARASYSNYGSCVNLFAPGSSITSAWSSSPTATRTISGTSMAAPHVAGMAARLLQINPGSSPSAVASLLTGSATTDAVSGTNGTVNLLANIVETPPAEEDPVEEPVEETPEEETPDDETPVEETPEEVAPPTTEPRRPGNSNKDKDTPPGRGKKASTPKAFTLTVASQGVTAQWANDPEATKYRLECALNAADALRNRASFILEVLPQEAILLPNRQLQLVLPPEALVNNRCWLVAELNGEPSDPSNVELVPWATARPGNTGATPGNSGNAPGLSGSTPGNSGNAPGLSGSTPGNSGNAPGLPGNNPATSGTGPGNSGNPGNPGNPGNSSSNVAPTPPSPPANPSPAVPGPPASAPGNSQNAPGRNNR